MIPIFYWFDKTDVRCPFPWFQKKSVCMFFCVMEDGELRWGVILTVVTSKVKWVLLILLKRKRSLWSGNFWFPLKNWEVAWIDGDFDALDLDDKSLLKLKYRPDRRRGILICSFRRALLIGGWGLRLQMELLDLAPACPPQQCIRQNVQMGLCLKNQKPIT